MHRLWRMLATLILCVMGISLLPMAVGAQQTELPQTNVQPKTGSVGTRFFFFARGFTPAEQLAIWLNAPDGRVLTTRVDGLNGADRTGRADWSWDAPSGIRAGDWQMVVRGVESGVERVITFSITYPSSVDAEGYNVQPKSGTVGTPFFFYATGFTPGERVVVWLNTPSGQAIDAKVNGLNNANRDGRVDWSWRSPLAAATGRWQMVARGVSSGVERVLSFEIIPQPELTSF